MKKGDLLYLWSMLEMLKTKKANIKFGYAMAKNRITIKPEVEAIQDAIKPSKEYREYDQARIELAREYADRDDDKIKIEGGNFIITKKLEEFNTKIKELDEKHADVISSRKEKMDEIETLLEEDVSFEPYKVSLENFPEMVEPEVIEIFMNWDMIK